MEKNYHPSWTDILEPLFLAPNFVQLEQKIDALRLHNDKTILPPPADVFNAFFFTKFEEVKVVIIGQDPYHGVGQAHGLSFSVQPNCKIPPSLRNIYTELAQDLEVMPPHHGCLEHWAQQGVLLLNAYLTVEESKPMAHSKLGWAKFTDSVISCISEKLENVVFILWGNFAIKKEILIDASKHLILKGVHPSPLSATRGFFGSKPFSKTNIYLLIHNKSTIHWAIQ